MGLHPFLRHQCAFYVTILASLMEVHNQARLLSDNQKKLWANESPIEL